MNPTPFRVGVPVTIAMVSGVPGATMLFVPLAASTVFDQGPADDVALIDVHGSDFIAGYTINEDATVTNVHLNVAHISFIGSTQ